MTIFIILVVLLTQIPTYQAGPMEDAREHVDDCIKEMVRDE